MLWKSDYKLDKNFCNEQNQNADGQECTFYFKISLKIALELKPMQTLIT